jgi:transcriptional regulator with XRE-family HTH domain
LKRLRNILKERNISAYQFAKDLGFPQSTVWEWLDGKYVPKAEKMATIADYLDVPIQVLIEDAIESKKETR